MRVGQGRSVLASSEAAACEAAAEARAGLEGTPGWLLVFAGGRHDRELLLATLRGELGALPVVGGAAVGTIDARGASSTHFELLLLLFPAELMPQAVLSTSLREGEQRAGRSLGAAAAACSEDGDELLLFYDSVRSRPPPELYVASTLLDGLYEGLDGRALKVHGAGLIGDFQMSSSYIFNGAEAREHEAVAVVLPSALRSLTRVMHGSLPISRSLTVTAVEGPDLVSLDGRPALEEIYRCLGLEPGEAALRRVCMGLNVGYQVGDPYAAYAEGATICRMIVGADPTRGSVRLFDDDFAPGMRVTLMLRDTGLMCASAARGSREVTAELAGRASEQLFALYVDCAGRAGYFSGGEVEEADLVRRHFGLDIPLQGCYSGVEFAPSKGRTRATDWNGVLSVFGLVGAS